MLKRRHETFTRSRRSSSQGAGAGLVSASANFSNAKVLAMLAVTVRIGEVLAGE